MQLDGSNLHVMKNLRLGDTVSGAEKESTSSADARPEGLKRLPSDASRMQLIR
jgi:hypothetical protein